MVWLQIWGRQCHTRTSTIRFCQSILCSVWVHACLMIMASKYNLIMKITFSCFANWVFSTLFARSPPSILRVFYIVCHHNATSGKHVLLRNSCWYMHHLLVTSTCDNYISQFWEVLNLVVYLQLVELHPMVQLLLQLVLWELWQSLINTNLLCQFILLWDCWY